MNKAGSDGRAPASPPRTRAQAAARMQELHPTEPGWTWRASAVRGAPGWWGMAQKGPAEYDFRLGMITFLGPGDLVLTLSSNPGIHDFGVTRAVLAELGRSGLSAEQLADEIFRRSQGLPSRFTVRATGFGDRTPGHTQSRRWP